MNTWLIVAGIVLLIVPALVAMQLIFWLVFEIVARNWHEYLLWPAVAALSVGGVWSLLSGLGVLR